jgi:hypothetical protein
MSETQSRLQISPDSSRRVSRLSHQSLEVCFCSALHLLCSRVLRVDIPDELLLLLLLLLLMTTMLLMMMTMLLRHSGARIRSRALAASRPRSSVLPQRPAR